MPTVWNPTQREQLLARLSQLDPAAAPRWGTMSPPHMVTHITDQMRIALGELPCKRINVPFRYFPLRELVVYVLPWPKGAPTAPEMIARAPQQWDDEIAQFERAIARVLGRHEHGSFTEHPAFGNLSQRAWGVLMYRHIDHHLRQFGV